MCRTKAAIAAMVLCAPLSQMALGGDGWRLSSGDGWRFGIVISSGSRHAPRYEPPCPPPPRHAPPRCETPPVVIVKPVRWEPPVVEHCEPVYTTLVQHVRIDGRDVRATLVLWQEKGEVRAKAILSAEGCELPDIKDVSFEIEQGRRSRTVDMDRVRECDDDDRLREPARRDRWGGSRRDRHDDDRWSRRDRDDDRRAEFLSDCALRADTCRPFEAVLHVKTCRGTECIRWCDIRLN